MQVGRMATITASVTINAPPSDVFAFVVDEWQGTLHFWRKGIRRWTPLSSPPLRDGFRVRYWAQVLAVPMPMEMEVCDFVPRRGWTAKSVRGPFAEGRWEFMADGQGTRFSYRLSYLMPPPGIGPFLDRWFFAPAWERAIGEALQNLKRLIEARQCGESGYAAG